MSAEGLFFNKEGMELNRKMDSGFEEDQYLELQEFDFNPRLIASVTDNPEKPDYCFVLIDGEQFTVRGSRKDFRAKVNEFFERQIFFN